MMGLVPDLLINLNDDKTYLVFNGNPDELKERLAALDGVNWVLIDEVQRHPTILNTVQTIIDDKKINHRSFRLGGRAARR